MLKYLVAIVILCGLTLFVARQDERTAQDSAQNSAQLGNGATSTKPNEQHPQENIKDTNRNTPRWYGFFRWPNGTTTWAIILTLLAIAEQTSQTAKAAQATRDSVTALSVSQRAQLVILPDNPIPEINAGNMPKVRIEVKNTGATPAYECVYDTWIEILPFPFTDFTEAATRQDPPFPFTIYAQSPNPIAIETRLMRQLEPRELVDLQAGRKLLCYRIRFDYTDAFGEQIWQDFGLVAKSDGMEVLPRYNDSGKKKSQKKRQNPN